MSSMQTNKKLLTRIVAVIVSMAFLLCAAIFALGFDSVGTAANPYASYPGIRFVQVAAGEDFAIGLTYQGELYGWSLLANPANNATSTLGNYYSATPTKIEFDFKAGPAASGSTYASWGSEQYNSTNTNETKILQIAATRTTAAFVTQGGYIYTWGFDSEPGTYANDTNIENRLLLRIGNYSTYGVEQCVPHIINYDYYDSNTAKDRLSYIRPSNTTIGGGSMSNISLAAGEYDYVMVFSRGSGNSLRYYSFVWGSTLYNVTNREQRQEITMNTDSSTGALWDQGATIRMPYNAGSTAATAVAGGYTVGINYANVIAEGGTSLAIHGKNFITSGANLELTPVYGEAEGETDPEVDHYVYSVAQTSETLESENDRTYITYSQTVDGKNLTRVTSALAGGRYANSGSGVVENVSQAPFYATQKAPNADGLKYGPSDSMSKYVLDAQSLVLDNALEGNGPTVIRSAVALGNDIGYAIDDDGKIYAWGDNAQGQSGLNDSDVKSYSAPNEITTLAGKQFLSVAAGKQLSATTRRAFNYENTFAVSEENGITFDSSVVNREDYITGAIDNHGGLYVWSNRNPQPTQIFYGNRSERNTATSRFIAVYSGYGNNLFAVTAQGKVVRIEYGGASGQNNQIDCDGGYRQTIYDSFVTGGTTPITNWTVANGAANTVNFKVLVSDNDKEPDLGKATFYLHGGERSQNTVFINDADASLPSAIVKYDASYTPAEGETPANVLQYAGSRQSLITDNLIGDTYRLLDSTYKSDGTNVDDANIKFLFVPSTLSDAAAPLDIEPKFFLNGTTTAMTPAQRDNMFSYRFVYSAENGVGFEITPKQSSKGDTVTVRLTVARYDSSENFKVEPNADGECVRPADNGVYYDYKTVEFRFVIENTPAYMHLNAFRGEIDEQGYGVGQSYIPLLDPNNDFNRVYSVAIQDVSTGFVELAKYLNGIPSNANLPSNDALLSAIIDRVQGTTGDNAIVAGDTGFPAVRKIAAGNLEYYLGATEAARAYSGIYQYLITDRDSDFVTIPNGVTNIRLSGRVSAVSATRETIKISLPVNITDEGYAYRIANLNTDFNNKYGLYNIKFNEDGSELSFWYDVIRITAVGSTGMILYDNATDENGPRTTGVTDYCTSMMYGTGDSAIQTSHVSVSISTNEYPAVNSNVETAPATGGERADRNYALAVFSQPSVRLITGEYGDHSATDNNYREIELSGTVGQTTRVELGKYVTCTDGIYFTFNDNTQDYGKFNGMFLDELNHREIFKLSEQLLTFTPTTAADQYVTVYIQRFNQSNATFGVTNGSGGIDVDEKIKLVISFKNITGVEFTKTNATTRFNISVPTEIDIMGGDNNAALVSISSASARDAITLTGLQANKNNTIVRVDSVSGSNTRILVTPISSGNATVMFYANLYGQSIPFILDFTVAGLTTMPDTINLSGVEYITVSSLQTRLRQQNSSDGTINNYNILYKDVDENGNYNAITFYDKDGNKVTKPSFISTVSFNNLGASGEALGNTNIRIAINDDAVSTDGIYYMRVRYVDTVLFQYSSYKQYEDDPTAAILEIQVPITSSRKILWQSNSDGTSGVFTLNIDCDNPVDSDPTAAFKQWYTAPIDLDKPGINDNMRVYIPLSYLLGMVQEDGINIDQYKVSLVQAPVTAATWFNAYAPQGGQYVIIEPGYNTPVDAEGFAEPVTINVTVQTDADVSANKVMLLSFRVTVSGISTTLSKDTYSLIWIVAASVSAAIVLIIFLIMLIVYFARRAKQRAIVKRNKELIKMRDRVHNKNSATREQLVKSKLRMEDPKFAAKYNELKNAQRDSMGVSVEGVDDFMDDGKKKKKKKKNGKKSIAELKAELEAKRAALGGQSPETVDPFASAVDVNAQSYGVEPQFGGDPAFGGDAAFGGDPAFGGEPAFGEPVFGDPGFGGADMGDNAIVFDASDMGDGSQG